MSRGLGKIQKQVLEVLCTWPGQEISVIDICLNVWPQLRIHSFPDAEDGSMQITTGEQGRNTKGDLWYRETDDDTKAVEEWMIPRAKYETVMRALRTLKRYVHLQIAHYSDWEDEPTMGSYAVLSKCCVNHQRTTLKQPRRKARK